jgi:hypothetical protein
MEGKGKKMRKWSREKRRNQENKIYRKQEITEEELPNSVEHSPSWEANSPSASQEIPRTSCNPKVHHRIHSVLCVLL